MAFAAATVGLLHGTAAGATPTPSEPQAEAAAPGLYQPLTPSRILDTRTGVGGPVAPVGPGQKIDVQVTGVGGVPSSGVGAVVLNLTGTGPTTGTFVTAYPTGQTLPGTSSLNLTPGQTAPNLAIVKVGTGGKVSLYNAAGNTDLIADIAGWMPTGSDYTALSPTRILDTRTGVGTPVAPVGPSGKIDVKVTGVGGVPSSGVGAVVLNLTGTSPSAGTFVTAYPAGQTLPGTSSLNLVPGETSPNLAIVKVGAGGNISLYNAAGTTHLIADIAGWLPTGSDYSALTPTRILDTRTGVGAPVAPVGPSGKIDVQVTGVGGVPSSGVGAVVLNLTGTGPSTGTFVTAYPTGQTLPGTSSLNLNPGQTDPNLVVVKVGAGGKISLYNAAGTTHLIADIAGWMPGTTPPAAAPPAAPAPVSADAALEARVVALTNEERVRNGCAAVTTDSRLTAAARLHSTDMATYAYFSHTGRDGSAFTDRAARSGYTGAIGENIAWGYRTPEDLMNGWMNSPGHRANILKCAAKTVGVGLARKADGTPYWTQVFGSA